MKKILVLDDIILQGENFCLTSVSERSNILYKYTEWGLNSSLLKSDSKTSIASWEIVLSFSGKVFPFKVKIGRLIPSMLKSLITYHS